MNTAELSMTTVRFRFLPVAGWWGLGALLAVLVEALVRLFPAALRPLFEGGLGPVEWTAYFASIAALAIGEGYRGFQKAFSPRAVARAFAVADQPTWVKVLAPLYVMGLVHATRRRLVINWCLTLGIVALIVAVARLPWPWRQIVDAGVVAGLTWGTVSILVMLLQGLAGRPPEVDLEHP